MNKILSRIISIAAAAATFGVQSISPFPENLFQSGAVSAAAITAKAAEHDSVPEASGFSAEPAPAPAEAVLPGDVDGSG